LSDSEISNIKHQIPNKSQIPISNDPNRFGILNFGHWDFFVPALARLIWSNASYVSSLQFVNAETINLKSVWARDLEFVIWNFQTILNRFFI